MGWPVTVCTRSWGKVTFFTTIESAVQTLQDFRGLLFCGGSLISALECDSSSDLVIVRIGALHSLLATTTLTSLDRLVTAASQACGGEILVH